MGFIPGLHPVLQAGDQPLGPEIFSSQVRRRRSVLQHQMLSVRSRMDSSVASRQIKAHSQRPHCHANPTRYLVDQRTSSSGGGNSAAALQLSSGSTIPFSAGLPLRPRRQSGGGDMEEKGIALPELSCRTGTEASAAVRQLRRCTPGAELPPKLCGCSGGCTPGAQLRAPHAGAAGLPPRPTPSGPASFGGSPAAPARGARRQVRQLSSRSAIPFSSMSRFMDFRESMPKFLSPNSSQPWLRYPRLRVFICCGSTRDVRRSLYDS
ncbi:unnamed protein product [Boreogadus saida]